ncbi:S8 family serine peptidase [bacterium]|nr:S8 family serine peptidase [bacterium]
MHDRKLGPRLREILRGTNSLDSGSTLQEPLRLWVRVRNPESLSIPGVRVESAHGGLAIARANPDAIGRLLRHPDVLRLEAPASCRTLLDESLPAIGMDRVRPAADTGPTGAGAIIGIVDSGIDWSHPDFIRPDGRSRILYLWDQTDPAGPYPSPFGTGTEYTRAELDDEIDGTPAGRVRARDESGHGTHVAGIAAGNGRGTGNGKASGRYTGMAPEADLIVVKTGTVPIDETLVAQAVSYIFAKAEIHGKPAVVNLSIGKSSQEGPHDGTAPLEQAINSLLGGGGRAVVTAAGNDGDKPIHFKGQFDSPVSNSLSVPFSVPANAAGTEDGVRFDIWSPPYTGLTVSVVTPSGVSYGPVSPMTSIRAWDTAEGVITVDNASAGPDPDNDDYEMRIRIADKRSGPAVTDVLATGLWRLDFTGKPGRFDGWLYESTMNAVLTDRIDFTTLLVEPAHARLAIAVASFVSRNTWPCLGFTNPFTDEGVTPGAISAFSSGGGPRPNTRGSSSTGKPEIVAPGEYVLSSLSRHIAGRPADHLTADDSVHWAERGTSMSAPHVAGLIALMFESDPALTSSDIKGILIASGRKTPDMGSNFWHNRWGYGMLDAYEAIRLTGIGDRPVPAAPHAWTLAAAYPNPFNGSTSFPIDVSGTAGRGELFRARIFDASGRTIRLLMQGNLPAGRTVLRWDGTDDTGRSLASGVYILTVTGRGLKATRKLVLVR